MLQKLKIIYTSLLDYENVLYLDGDIVVKKILFNTFKKMKKTMIF